MDKYLLITLHLLFALEVTSQAKGDYMWQIGQNSHPQENPYALSMVLDFNVLGINLDTFYRGMTMGYFTASISNDEGKLRLYSNGCRIRNGNHFIFQGVRRTVVYRESNQDVRFSVFIAA